MVITKKKLQVVSKSVDVAKSSVDFWNSGVDESPLTWEKCVNTPNFRESRQAQLGVRISPKCRFGARRPASIRLRALSDSTMRPYVGASFLLFSIDSEGHAIPDPHVCLNYHYVYYTHWNYLWHSTFFPTRQIFFVQNVH